VRASIHAREVVIHGRVAGNIRAVEKVELRKSANVVGDLATQRIAIEDGAYFKGGVDLQKQAAPAPPAPVVREPIADPVPETKPAAAAAGQSTIFEAGK